MKRVCTFLASSKYSMCLTHSTIIIIYFWNKKCIHHLQLKITIQFIFFLPQIITVSNHWHSLYTPSFLCLSSSGCRSPKFISTLTHLYFVFRFITWHSSQIPGGECHRVWHNINSIPLMSSSHIIIKEFHYKTPSCSHKPILSFPTADLASSLSKHIHSMINWRCRTPVYLHVIGMFKGWVYHCIERGA
jgi:hypothetical protein